MQPTLEQIVCFLNDEGLGPIKVMSDNPDCWSIKLNDPFIVDGKMRCGIALTQPAWAEEPVVLFNTYKSSIAFGDEYKGTIWKLIKNVKNFDTAPEAKLYFMSTYMLHDIDVASLFNHKTKVPTHEFKKDIIKFPDEFERLDINNETHKPYLDYLLNRKILLWKIKSYKLFVDKKQKRVIFTVYENDELIFWTGRAITKNSIPWLHKKCITWPHPIWGLDQANGGTCFIFEAIFDAAMVHNGLAIFGASNIQEDQINKILAKGFSKIIVCMDNDTTGSITRTKLAELLSDKHDNVWIYNFLDIKEKDFNEMAQNETDFELDDRLIKFNLKAQLAKKLKVIK